MAAYNSKPRRIKDALKSLFSSVQYDDEPAFVSVLDNTVGEFDGYPSLRVLPDSVDNEKSSTRQDERSAAYIARVHLSLESDINADDEAAVYDKVYDLSELVLDAVEQADADGALNAIDGTIGSYMMVADRGEISAIDSQVGSILMCDVMISVRYSKNL